MSERCRLSHVECVIPLTFMRQNKQGQTAGHYAISYQFFDMSEWLFSRDESGAGADDTVENCFGLGPYDGLQPDDGHDVNE